MAHFNIKRCHIIPFRAKLKPQKNLANEYILQYVRDQQSDLQTPTHPATSKE